MRKCLILTIYITIALKLCLKMEGEAKADKKHGLGEILLSAMAVGPCAQLLKRVRIRRKIK